MHTGLLLGRSVAWAHHRPSAPSGAAEVQSQAEGLGPVFPTASLNTKDDFDPAGSRKAAALRQGGWVGEGQRRVMIWSLRGSWEAADSDHRATEQAAEQVKEHGGIRNMVTGPCGLSASSHSPTCSGGWFQLQALLICGIQDLVSAFPLGFSFLPKKTHKPRLCSGRFVRHMSD